MMIAVFRAATFMLVFLASLAGSVAPTSAADYPNRPVRWLIGFTAGGPVDTVARIMAQWLSERFGQQFVVENRAGSGGNLAAAAAINSPPDGYTLLFVAPNNAISTSLYKKLPYDFIRDTVPVASIMQLTNMMVVPMSLPVKTVQDFIDYCKANPGKVSYASSGNGTSVHMSAELFKALTKVEMTHVPYRGAAPAINDLLGQQVQMAFLDLPVLLPHIKAGTLHPIALGASQPVPTAPDVPTTADVGMQDLLTENWCGMVASAKTPEAIVAALNRIANEAMADPSVKQKLADQGLTLAGDTPEHFRGFIDAETRKWAKVIKDAGVPPAK